MHGNVVDQHGEPLAGRCVSNGRDLAVTDAAGTWSLPSSELPFVWVHRGAGFDCADWYRRSAGPGEAAIVFEMTASSGERRRFAHITDLHVDDSDGVMGLSRGDCTAEVLGSVFAELDDRFGCDFVLATGDLTNRGTPDDFTELGLALDAAPLPVFHMPGNHDHYGDFFETGAASTDTETGRPSGRRYEARLGPRWWSITEAGLRIVAIDWHTWIHGVDDELQRTWLEADLAHAEPNTPVLILSHDLMSYDFFAEVASMAPHVRLVGSLSGHWHTARSARVDGQLHLNTGNPMFGSWDWSPPHVRLLEFDGTELAVETRALGVDPESRCATFVARPVAGSAAPSERVHWRATLDGVAHLGGPSMTADALHEPLAVVGWRDEDRCVGGVTALRTADGSVEWTVDTVGAVVGSVTSRDGVVAAVTIDGHVELLTAATGRPVWSAALAGERGMWVCARPLLTDDAVVVGSGPAFAGFDRHDGRRLWSRSDLGSHEMYPGYGDGLEHGSTVIIGMPSVEPSLYALDAVTGETVWATGTTGGQSPAGSLAWGRDDLLYGLSNSPELFCVDAHSGRERFRVAIDQAYTWAAPLATEFGVIVNMGDGQVACHDPGDGSVRWRLDNTETPASAPAFGPYRQRGPSSITTPVLVGVDRCVLASTDGRVRTIDLDSGKVELVVQLPAAVTGQLAISRSSVIVPTADGSVWSVRLG
jgi:outer membrane protein assembly factor BamB/predicted MPP superfamily phosphohydrolase